MTKKFFGGISAIAIVAAIAVNININANNKVLSDISLSNVEALAISEYTISVCMGAWGSCIDDVKAPYVKIEN